MSKITEPKDIVKAIDKAVNLLNSIDKRKIRYKNSWIHYIGKIEEYKSDIKKNKE